MNKTEIYVLAGFLGSGKTTLLKQLLIEEKKQNRKIAILMNELGKVSIDSDAVDDEVPLKELLDGCICCSIQEKLEAQLQGLLMNEKPEVIYIEATGVAHPIEVMDAVLSPLFADKLSIKGIISVVDGNRWLNRKTLSPQIQQLLIEQVRHADLILLNKTDTLTDGEQSKLTIEIQALNSLATTILTSFAKVPMDVVKKISLSQKEPSKQSHVIKDLKLSTFVYKFEQPVDQTNFETFLRGLPDTIYRIKGYIKFTSSKYPYLFQYSYGMPLYLHENMNMPLNLVFIGEKMDWHSVEKQLQKLEGH